MRIIISRQRKKINRSTYGGDGHRNAQTHIPVMFKDSKIFFPYCFQLFNFERALEFMWDDNRQRKKNEPIDTQRRWPST